jgi:hypothetical protein
MALDIPQRFPYRCHGQILSQGQGEM